MTAPDQRASDATILVVDDRAAKRYLLVSWLTRAGFTVIQADSGAAALARMEHEDVDLIVLDVRLGDMTGFEVSERIKADPRWASRPVIHVSAHAVDVGDRIQGLTRGADAYLVEPIEPDELIATTHAALRYYRARRRAELLAARLARLAETTLAVNSAPTLVQLLTAAVAGAAQIFGTGAVVAAQNTDGERLIATTTEPGTPVTIQSWPVDPSPVPVGVALRTEPPTAWPLLTGAEERIAVATARLRDDRPGVQIAVPDSALAAESIVLSQLVQALAAAVEAQRSYDQEHRIAVTLQRSLLPRTLPRIEGLDLAVRYEPASAQTEVGGDFYELAMIDGRLLVAIGDVAGHSLHAATVMAELRHAIRAYAVEGHPPGAIVARVDKLVRTLLPGEFATLCVLTLEPDTGRIRLASAGHLPALLVTEGGATTFVEHTATLLGVRANRPDDLELVLPPGATLVLYTDGLIERRDIDIDLRMLALAATAAPVDANLDHFCGRLLTNLAPPEITDDIAVVALRRH
ncbi:fused response regulator/phosphatase [Micromonospora sp. NBC_01796]|uniref:fused response regulator/phosphatase n=1 Tax=Micromonospora sp. NBC_01796 TaxID=2975987 RepID=UPI002DDB4A47|nr:fused response regulator/phosphatase [Micromonospora sp. NBC_01796]WSA86197.1 fused response regulator/phosphatase [Micromonospora sp. NBC_01796]